MSFSTYFTKKQTCKILDIRVTSNLREIAVRWGPMRNKIRTDWLTYDTLHRRGKTASREIIVLRHEIARAHEMGLLAPAEMVELVQLAIPTTDKLSVRTCYYHLGKWRDEYAKVRPNRPLPKSGWREPGPSELRRVASDLEL